MNTTPVLNPVRQLDVVGTLRLEAEITFHDPPECLGMDFKNTVAFLSDKWESELVWQAVQMIVRHNKGKEEAVMALETALQNLATLK